MKSIHHQRIDDVFNGRWPERIPICEQAFASSVASEILGREAFTGSTDIHYFESRSWMKGAAAHDDFVEQIYQDTLELHRVLDLDIFFPPWRMSDRPTKQIDENSFLYGNPDGDDWSVWQYDPGSRTYGIMKAAQHEPDADQVIEIMKKRIKQPRPKPELDPFLARAVRELGDDFVVSGAACIAVPMEAGWLEATALEPELVGEYLDGILENVLHSIQLQYDAGVRMINGGGDFAFNSGPIYSPAFFKKIMAPRWKKIFDFCRERGMIYIMRSDGNLWPVADDLFGWANPHAYYECDFDAGMRFSALRKVFPELVLMGNVSCDLLHNGTPADVRAAVLACIEGGAPRAIIASSNSILHGTPPANVEALYETAKSSKMNR